MSRELLRAILKNDINKIDQLRQNGADILDLTDKEGWNYLHRSLLVMNMVPDAATVCYLIDNGVDFQQVDVYGNIPLHYAVRAKKPELVKVLIENGSGVNTVNKDGVSPLREALLTKPIDYETVQILVNAGADINQSSDGGMSVVQFAKTTAQNDGKLMDILMQNSQK